MSPSEIELEETAAYVALKRLLSAYADAVNRRAWGDFEDLFLDDAVISLTTSTADAIEIVGPGALGRFIGEAIECFEFFQLVFLNSHFEIQRSEGVARGRNFMVEMRQDRASGRWTRVFGLYEDRYRYLAGRWKFEHRSFNALAATAGRDNHILAFPTVDW